MTISSTATRKAGPYAGNGSTVAFAFSFKVFADSDLVVTHTDDDGLETVKTLTTHYTATLNANQNSNPGGTVTMLTAPATGEKLTITSAVPKTQAVSLSDGGGFFASVVNNALDRLTIFAQELAERLGRAMSLPVSVDAGVSAELQAPEAGTLIGWNADGDAIINYLPTNGGMPAPGAITATYLANDAVEEEAILNGAVTTNKLGALAVTAAKLASNAVETAKIMNGAVTLAKLDSAVIKQVGIVSATHDISVTGSQVFTVGFEPIAIMFVSVVDGTSAVSVGFYWNSVLAGVANNHAASANAWLDTFPVMLVKGAGAYAGIGTVTTSATGFTGVWAKTGSPTGTAKVTALCFG